MAIKKKAPINEKNKNESVKCAINSKKGTKNEKKEKEFKLKSNAYNTKDLGIVNKENAKIYKKS